MEEKTNNLKFLVDGEYDGIRKGKRTMFDSNQSKQDNSSSTDITYK